MNCMAEDKLQNGEQQLMCQIYPPEWQQWSYRMARAIFRVYSGRTDIDPRHEHEAVKCTCEEAELCKIT
jgi:hypothetical protein